jgi:TetR/AcrR family transcriptional regulator
MARRGSALADGRHPRARLRPGPRRGATQLAGTREDLLRAGAETFAELGFDGATAERIAERAGATKAMINYHFRSKRGLYEAILLATFTDLKARLDGVRASGSPAAAQLRAFVEEFARAATEHPSFPAIMVREVLSGGKHLPEGVLPRVLGVMGVVRGIVEQGVEEGSFRPVNPLLTHLSLVGALLFFFATEPFRKQVAPKVRMGQAVPSSEAYVAHMQELMVRGLAAEPAPRRRS